MKLQLSQVQLSWNSCDLTLKVSLLPSFKTSDFADTFLFGHFTSKSLCTWSLCSYCQAFYFRVVQTSTFILWHWSVTWSQGASYNLVWTASWFYTVGATRVAHTLLLSLRTACYCQHSRVYRSVIPYNHLKKKKKIIIRLVKHWNRLPRDLNWSRAQSISNSVLTLLWETSWTRGLLKSLSTLHDSMTARSSKHQPGLCWVPSQNGSA